MDGSKQSDLGMIGKVRRGMTLIRKPLITKLYINAHYITNKSQSQFMGEKYGVRNAK